MRVLHNAISNRASRHRFELWDDAHNAGYDTACSVSYVYGGCTLQNICEKSSVAEKSMYCMQFGLLKTLCVDMPGMSGTYANSSRS